MLSAQRDSQRRAQEEVDDRVNLNEEPSIGDSGTGDGNSVEITGTMATVAHRGRGEAMVVATVATVVVAKATVVATVATVVVKEAMVVALVAGPGKKVTTV